MAERLRAVIYARVSGKAQREAETIESQLELLPCDVERQGWELARAPRHYVDDGRTAKDGHLAKRTAFTRLIADAAAGEFDVVVVYDVDRLTRAEGWKERGQIIGPLQAAGVRIYEHTTGQLHDASTSHGDLILSIRTVLAAEENRKRRMRSLHGRARAIRLGKNPAGPPPYGLDFSKNGGWSVVDAEAEVIREIYQRIIAGEPCSAIGLELEERGIKSPRGGRWAWSVWNLAHKATYRGLYQAGGLGGAAIAVPAIVDDATWYAAQAAMHERRRRGLNHTRHPNLVAGLAFCALCGERLWVTTETVGSDGVRRNAYYVCPRRRTPRHGQTRCGLPWVNLRDVEAAVWSVVIETLERPDVLEDGLGVQAELDATAGAWVEDLRRAEDRLRRLERVQETVLDRFRRGMIPEAVMDRELAAAARDRAFTEQQLAAARAQAQAAGEGGARVGDLVGALDQLRANIRRAKTVPARREIVEAVVDRVEVDGSGQVWVDVVVPRDVARPVIALAGPRRSQDDDGERRIRVLALAR